MSSESPRSHRLKAISKTDAPSKPEESSECPKCYGTGMEIVAGHGARICECRQMRFQDHKWDSVQLPSRYNGFHFSNYKTQNESQAEALLTAMDLVMKYPADERGLLLTGSVGVGKTHLAVSILKGLTERGFNCLFYEFGTLLKEIQDSYNANTHTSELNVLAPVVNVEVLVLDELGATKPTDWVRDTMAYVINARYNDKKLTVFTTNYLDLRRNDREEVLEDRIGTRLRSRLYEMCRTVLIEGKDYRRTFDRQPGRPGQ